MDEIRETALALKEALDQKFGQDIVALDLRSLPASFDCFVIATGGSLPQIQTLAQATEECLEKCGLPINHIEGMQSAKWVLLDAGHMIVHIFDKENRGFYNLERVWGDAKIID